MDGSFFVLLCIKFIGMGGDGKMRAVYAGGCLLVTSILSVCLGHVITERAEVSFLTEETVESPEFRAQLLPENLFEEIISRSKGERESVELLTSTMLNGKFCPVYVDEDAALFQKYKEKEYEQLLQAYQAIWQDVKYFPVAGEGISYIDSWMTSRTYGGERSHEGTDIFGAANVSDYYPVVSMTDGEVEQVGWLNLGGYRIGIRTPVGGYFYYAHLSSYDRAFQKGDSVQAGEILGFMGDTGYGTEGTRGRFPVHLHLGIYICTENFEELSVNPYWILRAAEKRKISM